MIEAVVRRTLRVAATSLQAVRRGFWFVQRPKTFGVHAFAITPRRTLVIVRLRYAPGWRLPGGGRQPDEDPRDAVLRECREEIGMHAHGAVQLVSELDEEPDFKRDTVALFIVRGVEYRPRWSLEVEAVREIGLDQLPKDLSERTRRWLMLAGPFLAGNDPEAGDA
ncbi:MAG: NUDIX domain-containing protein [Allosphingosinicella sp.]